MDNQDKSGNRWEPDPSRDTAPLEQGSPHPEPPPHPAAPAGGPRRPAWPSRGRALLVGAAAAITLLAGSAGYAAGHAAAGDDTVPASVDQDGRHGPGPGDVGPGDLDPGDIGPGPGGDDSGQPVPPSQPPQDDSDTGTDTRWDPGAPGTGEGSA